MSGRWRWILGLGIATVAVAATLAIGLAGNDGDAGNDDRAPAGLELADLEPVMLRADDLDGAWTPTDPEPEEESDPGDFGLSPECQEVFEDFERSAEDDEELTVEFEHDEDQDTLEQTLALIGGDDPSFGEVRRALERCGEFSFHDDESDSDIEARIGVEEADGFGDESFAVTFDIAVEEPLSVEIQGYGLYLVRRGVVVTVVTFGGFDEDLRGTAPDRDLVRELAGTVDARLQDALDTQD